MNPCNKFRANKSFFHLYLPFSWTHLQVRPVVAFSQRNSSKDSVSYKNVPVWGFKKIKFLCNSLKCPKRGDGQKRNTNNSCIMTSAIPRGLLFQRAVVTAETDKFRIAQFCMLFAWVCCNNSFTVVFTDK